jgi:internalin A
METDCLPNVAQKLPKLRWYQWRLRSLFLLILLAAIGMSWLTVTIQNQRKQRAAADEIMKAGGWATSEQTWLGKLLRDDSLVSVTEVHLFGNPSVNDSLVHLEAFKQLKTLTVGWTKPTASTVMFLMETGQMKNVGANRQITDAGLVHLRGLSQLQTLDLTYTGVTDAGLASLAGLRQLEELDLSGTEITDAGLVHLKGLAHLQNLNLWAATKVTDAGLVHLKDLPKLQTLNVSCTRVTDAGMVHIEEMGQLRELDLSGIQKITDAALPHLKGLSRLQNLNLMGTNVTDAGLMHLRGMTQLQSLIVAATQVTAEGVQKLQKVLPKCKITNG